MSLYACAYGVKSEISLHTGDSASNAIAKSSVLSAFKADVLFCLLLQNVLFCLLQRCAESACVYYGLRVCEQKYITIICDRLGKSYTTVE